MRNGETQADIARTYGVDATNQPLDSEFAEELLILDIRRALCPNGRRSRRPYLN
jgi:hypothetical protein